MTTNATVTLLFSDLINGTELLEQLGEDGAQTLRRTNFQLQREAIAAHGGQEVKTMGDGLMVVFQSAVDAVACALTIAVGTDRHNRRDPRERLDVRLGLNVGEPTREGEDYFGLPVVVAKRLCDSASAGQILVSDVVRALAGPRTAHRFRPVEPIDLKGVGLTPAYEVAWEPPTASTIPLPAALVAPSDACFVGRDRELERLRVAWKDVASGTRRAVLVGGEPGVGKTRLASEVAAMVQGDGTVLYGRCDEDLGVPYQPFAEALRASVLASSEEDLTVRIGRSGASLCRLVPELRDRLPELPPALAAEAEAERYLLFEAVAEYLAAASAAHPMLLVLDDLHWAAKPTLVLLRHLLRSTLPMSVLILGIFRDTELDRAPLLAETLADLRRDVDVDRISLSGLDRASVAAFVAAAGYDTSAATTELAEAVHAGTEGNPFFVGEVLRHLQESGEAALGDVGLPPAVKDVVISRLTRLSPGANEMLTLASVAGARFDLALLERLTDTSADNLLDALDEAVRARVIVELPIVGQYTFAHALIRQVLVGELTASRRARLHWRITQAIESLPDARHRVEELAFHATEAGAVGDVVQAAGYALAASRQALERLAYEPAVDAANQGLIGLTQTATVDHRLRAELHLALAEACNFTGDMPAMKGAARRAADDARACGWVEGIARAAVFYGRWVELGMPDPVAEELCEEALAGLPDDDLTWRARVLTTLANYRVNGLSLGAAVRPLADESLALARRANDHESLAWSLYLTATTLVSDATAIDQRLRLAEELVVLSEDRDDHRGRLDGHVVRATTRLEQGDLPGFIADTAALELLAERLHWWAADWWADNFRVTEATLLGQFEEAEVRAEAQFKKGAQDVNAFNAYSAQIFTVRREMGRLDDIEPVMAEAVAANPSLIAFRCALALTWTDLGRDDDAATELDALAQDDFALLPRDVGYTSCLALLSETAAALGAPDHAARLGELLAPHAGRIVVGGMGIVCLGAVDRYLGMLAASCERGAEAAAHYAAAAELETALGTPPSLARTQYWWGRLLLGEPDDGRARQLLAAAADGAERHGMARLLVRVREAH
ncbi:MAG TPA: AAA family ATPase [Acidimicrobiales bacterium]|nr:AAA family ATPase [Acidimicrobiales bacterium]